MTRSLSFKLVVAFLIVSITGVVLTAVFARWSAYREFNVLVLDRTKSEFVAEVTNYYQVNGSWQNVDRFLHVNWSRNVFPQGQPPNNFGGPPPGVNPALFPFVLVDNQGQVLIPAAGYNVGQVVSQSQIAQGTPVEVDGEVVGTVLVSGVRPTLDRRESRYLANFDRASLYAALAAIILAVFLGIVFTRNLTGPLNELTQAIRAMAKGDLHQTVPVNSKDELGELAQAFNSMSAELDQALQSRRRMTADIAHDLRTPLTVIAGYLEAMQEGVLESTPQRLEVIYREVQHLQGLVSDLRTLSQADAGELRLNLQEIPLQEILQQAAAAYQPYAAANEIDLRVEVADSLPKLQVDEARMAQVMGNLIGNALRYTEKGGSIQLSARQVDGQVEIAVEDTGAGIAPEDLPHVFERLYRADRSRQTENGESGLGLAIARALILAHGGSIEAESTLGKGTRMIIRLPIKTKRSLDGNRMVSRVDL